jgi:hypothetical protein
MPESFAVPQIPDGYFFQQDGTPPYFWTPVTEFLNKKFTGMWISQGGPIQWPL